jgi:hypothetical protein
MNLPPAACRVDNLHAALKRQTSFFPQHQNRGSGHIQGQTTLLACNRLCLPCPEFLGFTNDREIVLQSANFCLYSLAKIVVERQSQPIGSSFISAQTKANREKALWVDRPASSSVLCQGSSCSPQLDPSFQYAINGPG